MPPLVLTSGRAETLVTRVVMSLTSAWEEGMPIARPLMLGSALSRLTAWSIPSGPPARRAVIMTRDAPERRMAVAEWRPMPREPGES